MKQIAAACTVLLAACQKAESPPEVRSDMAITSAEAVAALDAARESARKAGSYRQ